MQMCDMNSSGSELRLEKPNERRFYYFVTNTSAHQRATSQTKAMTARRSVNVWPKKGTYRRLIEIGSISHSLIGVRYARVWSLARSAFRIIFSFS